MDTSDPTEWITKSVMETALKRHLSCETITLESMDVEPANTIGAGYGSLMSRVKVTFRRREGEAAQQLPLIVKANFTTDKPIEKWDIFKLEAIALSEVMTSTHEALRRVEGSSFQPLSATCFHYGDTPRAFLVLDDLKAAGYRLADAGRPLDYQHCEVVMRAYARLHAGTAYVLSKRPDYGDPFNVDFFSADFTELMHVSSPARDLVYFLYANATLDAHERLSSLLETYHSQLQTSLRALGMVAAADAYPLDELLKDMEDLKHFALYTSSCSGFVLYSEQIGEKFTRALRELNFQPDTLYGIYDNEYSRPYMQYIIRQFASKGLL